MRATSSSLGGRILTGDADAVGRERLGVSTPRKARSRSRAAVVAGRGRTCAVNGWLHRAARGQARLSLTHAAQPGARLNGRCRSGFLITPMTRGIRLTTGVAGASRYAADANSSSPPVEPVAREFAAGARVDGAPARPPAVHARHAARSLARRRATAIQVRVRACASRLHRSAS